MENNEFQKHKKSDKIKWILTVIAFLLVAVMIAGLSMQLFGKGNVKPSSWFDKANSSVKVEKGEEPNIKVQYVDLQINAYDKDENNQVLETTHVLAPNENNVVTFMCLDYKLAVPTINGVSADKYKITYFKAPIDSDVYEEITETAFLESNPGNYKFNLEFTDATYARVKSNPITLVIEKKVVDFGGLLSLSNT